MSFVAIIAATLVLGLAIVGKPHAISQTSEIVARPKNNLVEIPGHLIDGPSTPPQSDPLYFPPTTFPTPETRQTFSVPDPQTNDPAPINPIVPSTPTVPDKLYDPNSAYLFAVGDLLTIPIYDQKYIRYLSLYNIPKQQRKEMAAVISFMANSLSTRKKMYIPEFVGASNETLIRIDIRLYEWSAEVWENLGAKGSGVRPFPEPYFHLILEKPIIEKKKVKKQVTKKVFSHYDNRNQPVWKDQTQEVEVVEDVANKREFKADPCATWLDPLARKTLLIGTCSEFPVFRADWFIANVSLPPAYYDFLKLGKTDKDFEKLIFADEKLAAKARSQDKGVVITSMVARNNRTLNRSPTFTGGYYWVSHDSLKSVDDRNYVQFLLDENFDATEDIGTLPNGLQAYFLTDGKGNRLDVANPDIAIDNVAVDRLVRSGRSCMVCHADGIRPIADEVRALTRRLQNREQIQLLVSRKEDAYRIEDLFSSDLDYQIIKDQNLYREAVSRATGMQSETVSKALNLIYNWYAEDLVTVDILSREVGIEFSDLQSYIRASKDNLILGLIKNPTRPIRRDQWETSFQRFQILIMARKQGLDHADPFPPGPLITLPNTKP